MLKKRWMVLAACVLAPLCIILVSILSLLSAGKNLGDLFVLGLVSPLAGAFVSGLAANKDDDGDRDGSIVAATMTVLIMIVALVRVLTRDNPESTGWRNFTVLSVTVFGLLVVGVMIPLGSIMGSWGAGVARGRRARRSPPVGWGHPQGGKNGDTG